MSPAAIAAIRFGDDRLPEADEMITVCDGLGRHMHELAHAHRTLGAASVGWSSRPVDNSCGIGELV